ncbi:unnamed protein product [Ceratitis capitata]|uniref:(Mediterranean fruit fly) hypothetical protein n=1 Tax=Ceratitis capitata TaxID=7213 RepID=A0A811UNP5_CERCA|nr:unnamed protein product [Ceratitis capitata]
MITMLCYADYIGTSMDKEYFMLINQSSSVLILSRDFPPCRTYFNGSRLANKPPHHLSLAQK